MSFNVYYQDELLALRTLGKEFAPVSYTHLTLPTN